jgi:hypothetical protein
VPATGLACGVCAWIVYAASVTLLGASVVSNAFTSSVRFCSTATVLPEVTVASLSVGSAPLVV